MESKLYLLLRFIFKPVFKVLYRPKIVGMENIPNTGGLVIACNHKHALDPLMIIMTTKRTIHFLAKKEIYKGVLKFFFNTVGTLPVDRGNSNKKTISRAEDMLKMGGIIGLFPEGTRNKTNDDLLPFKKGAVSFAKNTDCKILPVYIKGKYKLFRRSLVIIIGKPYSVKGDLEEENNKLRNKIASLNEMRY